jgi:hypothetical protein
MKAKSLLLTGLVTLFAAILIFSCAALAAGPNEKVLHDFQGTYGGGDGALPAASLVADSLGNLYGTTFWGGTGQCIAGETNHGCGTVFEVSPPATQGGAWTETVLYSFRDGSDGGHPLASLIFDPQGNLYGTAAEGGGVITCGVVFELSPPASKRDPWTETVLYTFTCGTDGASPAAGLVRDQAGNLYGTTTTKGEFDYGTVFQLTPPNTKGGSWTETTLHGFPSSIDDGATPVGNLIMGKGGDLYGATEFSGEGVGEPGAIYRLTPPKKNGGAWSEEVLYLFKGGTDGKYLLAGLVFDRNGNLYGTTPSGGSANGCGSDGCGTVFRLEPRRTKGPWKKTVLYTFMNPSDAEAPEAPVTFDKKGNLYGTSGGGPKNLGAVFQLSRPAVQGEPWTETTLHDFEGGKDGSFPRAGLIVGIDGAFYGTTSLNDVYHLGNGTVFRIAP